MDKEEFLFLIPGVLYGIAVFDLLSLIRNKKPYWESQLWAGLLFFTLIAILFNLYEDLTSVTSSILYYTLYLFSPIFFVQACYLITPKEDHDDMKEHFIKKRKLFFGSLTGLVFINFLIHILITDKVNLVQSAVFVALFGINIFVDKVYVRMISVLALVAVVIKTYALHL